MAAIDTNRIDLIDAATSSRNKSLSTIKFDNHAAIILLGINCLPVHDFSRIVDVSGYNPKSRSVECPTISGDVAYDHIINAQLYMLVYRQDICCKILNNYLICPMQIRVESVKINEMPIVLVDNQNKERDTCRCVR